MSRPKKTKFNPAEELQSTEIGPEAAEINTCTVIVVRDPAQPPADVGSPGKEYVLALRNTAELHETLLERIRKQKPKLAEDVKEAEAVRAWHRTDGPCPAFKRARERKEWQEHAKKINETSDILMGLQDQCNLDLICVE